MEQQFFSTYKAPMLEADTPEIIQKERAEKFKIIFLPTLLYSLLTTFFLYDNFNSIMVSFFAVTTVIYFRYMLPKFGLEIKKGFYYYSADIVLFGIANMFTANKLIVFFNNIAIFTLIIAMLLYTVFTQKKWSIAKYIDIFMETIIFSTLHMFDFFHDMVASIAETKNQKTKSGLYCLIGILISIPLLVVLFPLLSSADLVFGNIVNTMLEKFFTIEVIFFIPLFFCLVYLFTYGQMRLVAANELKDTCKQKKKWSAIIINTVLLVTDILYLFFAGIQIFSLFLGKMELPYGYTYAEYAREGFFELMFVCLLNLCIVIMTKELFDLSNVTRVLLCIICGCTYIMLISSALRLYMYINVYNLTTLRIEVAFALVTIGVCMGILIISVFNDKLPLMHSLTIAVSIGLLCLSFARPDAIAAKYNYEHAAEIEQYTNYSYYSSLSADAAPYMKYLSNTDHDAYYEHLMLDDYSWRQFNISRYIAMKCK